MSKDEMVDVAMKEKNVMSNRGFCLRICLGIVILMIAYSPSTRCQTSQSALVLDSQIRKQIVENIIRELKDKYIAPERVKDIESYLRKRLQDGAYDQLDKPTPFTVALTEDLRAASKDGHLFVTYDPDLERAVLAAPPTPGVELPELPPTAEHLAAVRRSNYGFRKLEILRGNVGYLDLRGFVDLNQSKETAVAAMNFLANTDAVIIDLRNNPGGYINIETFLASYFYGVDPVELLSRYHREGDVTVREWTLRELPGKRLPDIDLYILTSHDTASAGEAFSFIMQRRNRARIIGERTAGGGYGNRETSIGNGFVFFVSVFRQFDPRTGRGWQEVGVEPDVAVTAARALSVAHFEAVKTLAAKATDERRKQQLSGLAALLDFEANGAKQVPATLLQQYVGKYTGITISLEQGQLYFLGASGVRRKLHALALDFFLIEDASVPPENQARVRFIKNAQGMITELQLVVADGRSFPRAREK
jgi:retinol-binding protein 3